ncbi:hypothetical protein NP493_2226g00007 [Ridgeia piscesae]|uniref:Alfy-like armadillo-like repeat domain-containing protein n=2 Tax=Ridgeia piscesae TaxID=27915 RepID=A0AAD9N4K6_RIDPI|nr:hypothetical protein NP493_2226g00007 [Ridgeia piscesae]
MALCVDNMRRVQELSPIELVEMFVTVFCFLKDSSDVSQLLLDDFRSYQGYNFLAEFLLKMEQDRSEEAIQALRNLLLLVGSLTTCGYVELRPSSASAGSLFQMPGFTIPQPVGKGVSVRNLHAFQVLQTVFLKANYPQLCSTILDVISSIYHQDNANYFIVEPQNTLSQFAEKIHTKSVAVRVKFFEMMEFIVFNLNFVPCKELISLSILIKTNHSPECSLLCMKTLLNILSYNAIYKDAFREVGLLEVMVTCLHRYAALLKAQQDDTGGEIAETDKEMGFLVMEGLAQILSSNNSNAGVFRECGGARCVHNMVPYAACRQQALNIVQQLVLSSGGDDDLATLLGLMHTAPSTAVELNTHILKSLLNVLRESHRTRMAFRKVGGFVYVMSVLVSMEGCLADPPKAPWHQASRKEVVTLLKTVFSTLTVAMRYEPANARLFANEVRYSSLTEAVRLLGCFSTTADIEPVVGVTADREGADFADYFVTLDEARLKMKLPRALLSACLMLRYLYDMALDSLDIPLQSQTSTTSDSPRHMKRMSSVLESSSDHDSVMFIGHQKRASTGSLVHLLTQCQQEMLIVHPGALTSFLHLIPAISHASQLQLALELQLQSCECLKSLVRSERNQQVMCDAGLPHELLMHCNAALADESHPLHPPLQYIFERLAAQSLTPKDLRNFLRLGAPLCCASENEDTFDARHSSDPSGPTYAFEKPQVLSEMKKGTANGGTVPLTRVKCLVSMTTPRDVRLHGASITPAFIEFDMNAEGFGCLYLPSIAPQGPPTPSVVGSGMMGGSDPGVVGGIGSGE